MLYSAHTWASLVWTNGSVEAALYFLMGCLDDLTKIPEFKLYFFPSSIGVALQSLIGPSFQMMNPTILHRKPAPFTPAAMSTWTKLQKLTVAGDIPGKAPRA